MIIKYINANELQKLSIIVLELFHVSKVNDHLYLCTLVTLAEIMTRYNSFH